MERNVSILSILKTIARGKAPPRKVQKEDVIAKVPADGKARRRKRKRDRRKERKRQEMLLVGERNEVFNKCGYKTEVEVKRPFHHSCMEKWPENDILGNLRCIETCVKSVINEMKKIDVGVNLAFDNVKNSFPVLSGILRKFAKRHLQAPYRYMAWHYASLGMVREMKDFSERIPKRRSIRLSGLSTSNLPSDDINSNKSSGTFLQFASCSGKEFTKCDLEANNFDKAVPADQILRFLSSCVRHTIPLEFFGCAHNRRYFLNRWLPVLVGIPGKKSVGLGYLMHRIKICQIEWSAEASPVGGRGQRACIVAKAWLWLLLNYVGVILSCHFVMVKTSGEGLGGRPYVFFAKRVWQYLKSLTIDHHTEATKKDSKLAIDNKGWAISKISSEEMEKMMKSNGSPLPAQLQLRPKRNSMRPVLAVRVLRNDGLKLRACVALLQYLAINSRKRCPTHKTLDDISEAWAIMYEKRKAATELLISKEKLDKPEFYGITVDVKDAFGCVLHDKLCKILQEKLEEAKLNSQTVLMLRVVKLSQQDKKGTIRYKYRDELVGFPVKLTDAGKDVIAKSKGKQVIEREPFQVGDLYEFLNRCIKCQTLKTGKKFYLLSRGLAQGSPLSCYLWKIYCDALEDEHLIPHLSVGADASEFSYLIRGTDDYLFLTEVLEEAKWFLQRMTKGFPDFNVQVRPSKNVTTLNEEEALNAVEAKVKYTIGLKFWGMELNPVNLSVMADYGGPPGRDVTHALNLYVLKKPKRILESKSILGRLKLLPILLNVDYSGYKVVAINIYRAALMQASYFHAAVKIVFSFQNQVILIEILSRKVCSLVSRIISIAEVGNLTKLPERSEIFWLAYSAYKRVLGYYGGKYSGVLKALKWLEKFYFKRVNSENRLLLKEVIDSCNLSNDFTKVI